MNTINQYILYIGQDANFQSRSMLIPYNKLMINERGKHIYDLLKQNSHNTTITHKSKKYIIDNLILRNLIKTEEGYYQVENTEISRICTMLNDYADNDLDDYCFNMDDKEWYDDSITNICEGFNHIENYLCCLNMTSVHGLQIDIIDSFLMLETRDGKLQLSNFDTVNEMMAKLYGIN